MAIVQESKKIVDIFGIRKGKPIGGIAMESKFKPPKPFFRYMKSEYSYSRFGNGGHALSDDVQNQLLCAAYGVTAWLRTKNGAGWCFRLCGMEEVDAHHGFNYFYVPPHGERRSIDSDHRLRIFRRTKHRPVEIYQSAVDTAKKVVYTEGWDLPPDDMIKTAIASYREWLQKEDGFEWLKSCFRAIMEVDVHGGVAYRCTSVNGEVYWIGDDNIKSEAKKTMVCINCDMSYPCTTNIRGVGDLCNRCYGENFGEIDVLTLCNRHECQDFCCENYLSDGKLEDILFGKYGALG